ncbi:alpha/beta fold hydrolase [Nonomuraea gerenzanensis]|uniref:Hydrolase n=1 Tax=Nonomuraea gerenzanensis TaxID=93944 RepID=A0A1M4EFS8_9ACTN|nr:alpha/beta fold hydrolase [Nonomuraea gerenzanensis]UBU09030.1 alpha/beta fold hydrolase [Nonomuraea gerenzanensis]SBO97413.1 Hydrolase [Nonomuraea gerenzanensis]
MRLIFTTLIGLVTAASLTAEPAGPREPVKRSDFHVTSDPGVRIAVREVSAPGTRHDRPPVLLLHGARVPGVASFDLRVPGGSLAEDLARAGHRVYVMDARGYGASTRPAALSRPPQESRPAVRSDEVVRDVAAVVDRIAPKGPVALLGWATGAHWLGQYAAANPGRVSHLVLYNTLYGPVDGHPTLGRGSDSEDPAHPGRFDAARYGAYRLSTGASLLPSWDSSIPAEDKTAWRDPALADAYIKAALASDPTSGTRTPPSFRAPSGAMEDSFYLATGRQLWDAGTITARTLIVRSERDFWSRPEDVTRLREHLVHAREVRSVELPEATHYVHLDRAERGRERFVREVVNFLGLAG